MGGRRCGVTSGKERVVPHLQHRGRPPAVDLHGQGPAVLLLHGQPGSRADWSEVARILAADHQVIVPDRPGYGQSTLRARGFAGNADAMLDLLDRLGVQTATVLGYSWAGGVAIAMAERHPERVRGLVLAASVGDGAAVSLLDRIAALPVAGVLLTVVGFKLLGNLLLVPRVRRALAQGVVPESEQRLAAIGRAWRKSRAWRSFLTEQRALLVETPVLAAGLGSIHMPTVVVVGEHDRNVTPLAAAALAEAIPGARLVTLPGVGHLLPQQAPVDLARIVAEVAGRGARRNG